MWRSGSSRRPLRSSPGVPYLLPYTCYTSYLPLTLHLLDLPVLPVDTRLVFLGKTTSYWSVTLIVCLLDQTNLIQVSQPYASPSSLQQELFS